MEAFSKQLPAPGASGNSKWSDINNMLDVIGVERVLEQLELPRILAI